MQRLKKIVHLLIAVILIFLGLIGLVLPILNGTLLLLLGFILFSFESKYVEYHLNRLAHKSAFTGTWYEKIEKWMRRTFNK